jgi:hypothetical protein
MSTEKPIILARLSRRDDSERRGGVAIGGSAVWLTQALGGGFTVTPIMVFVRIDGQMAMASALKATQSSAGMATGW